MVHPLLKRIPRVAIQPNPTLSLWFRNINIVGNTCWFLFWGYLGFVIPSNFPITFCSKHQVDYKCGADPATGQIFTLRRNQYRGLHEI